MYRLPIPHFLVALLMLGVTACHSDGLYDPCPLSKSIVAACSDAAQEGLSCTSSDDCGQGLSCVDGQCSDGTAFTCVVAEHPFCLEEICASWQGAPSVCTRECAIDDDCPGEGRCVQHQSLRFCVDGPVSDASGVFESLTGGGDQNGGSANGGTGGNGGNGGACNAGQWQCADGACISTSWRCDGENDCAGGEDEAGCEDAECGSGQWQCDDGTCISKSWCRDGEYDCEGGEDEGAECN